jgi:predicted nucleic acid-binding protein
VAVILDTNAVSALLAGNAGLSAVLGPAPRHHLPVIVLGEYRYGLLRSSHREKLEALLETLIRESIVLFVDEATTKAYAQVRDELRQAGRPIPENDIWIAALARQHSQPVVSQDGHFDDVPNLRRLSW